MWIMNLSGAVASIAILAAGQAAAAPKPGLSPAERQSIERACERALVAYALATDANDAAGIYTAYAVDGAIDNGRTRLSGRPSIEAYFRQRVSERIASGMETRHVLSNVLVTPVDRLHAHGVAYEVMYRYPARGPRPPSALAPALIATITAEFVRTPEGWRFKRRDSVEVAPAP